MLHLDDAMIATLVDRADAERAVRDAFGAWGRGEAATTQRVRATVDVPPPGAMASAMAAVVPPYSGGKIYATNRGRFTFLNVLFHTDGRLLATLDGDVITLLRTAAASAIAIDLLADRSSSVAAVIGTGKQAWPHIEMLAASLPDLRELRICGRQGAGTATRLAERAGALATVARAYDDPAAAVDGADVIVTLTSSRRPLFPAGAVADNALICAVGATKHDRAEIGSDVVARCATIVCDDVIGSQTECGDLIHAAAAGVFDWPTAIGLNVVVAGLVTPDRAGRAPVLFETQGVAIQDVALSALAYERWSARGQLDQ